MHWDANTVGSVAANTDNNIIPRIADAGDFCIRVTPAGASLSLVFRRYSK